MDMILPKKGDHRPKGLPIWEEDRQMFIMDERESKGGHRSYKGVRVTDRFMTIEYVGNYHTIPYINALELYVYDGYELKLAGKREFDKRIYNKTKIREDFEELFKAFILTQAKMLNHPLQEAEAIDQAKAFVNSSYCSMTDENSAHLLKLAAPMLPEKNYFLDY